MEEGQAVKTPLLVTNKLANNFSSSSSSVTFVVVGYSSPAESGIVNDLGLTLAEAMGVSDLFFITGWLAITFSKGAWSLNFGRFLVGCGVGLVSYVVPVYIAEITTKDVRGTFLSAKHLMICCGKAVSFIVGSFISWRALALLGLVPCLLQLLGLFFIPESPRWLMTKDRVKDSETSLYRLRGENADISEETADIKNYTEYCSRISGDGILTLFQHKYAYCLIVGVGLMVFQQISGLSGMSYYTSAIFLSAGFSSKIGSIMVGIAQIMMALLGLCLIDRFGRRPLLLVSAAGLCLGCVLAGLSFFLQDLHFGKELTPALALLGLLFVWPRYGRNAMDYFIRASTSCSTGVLQVHSSYLLGFVVLMFCSFGKWYPRRRDKRWKNCKYPSLALANKKTASTASFIVLSSTMSVATLAACGAHTL
ncbi:hypothetical protein TIFTF001_000827 [Ficus carica]|uniref:Major facilitator superfamily (MFS) profile domain-containing protein n=1 Tax=Ficus carica TaxID=3494 RepID=A0AA88CQ22_FICCA|nr:hypothetical protein TIFTF001_000827 [Ficus carica]